MGEWIGEPELLDWRSAICHGHCGGGAMKLLGGEGCGLRDLMSETIEIERSRILYGPLYSLWAVGIVSVE